jgi:spore maturation protein CgeB
MRIAYVGTRLGNSGHRGQALRRLGHEVEFIDPWDYLGRTRWVDRWFYHAGGIGVSLLIDGAMYSRVRQARPDLVWVNQGEFLGTRLIRRLRELSVPIVNYVNDDPFGGTANGRRFRLYLGALPFFDLVAVVREPNIHEAKELGARRVIRVFLSADEVAHKPRVLGQETRQRFASEVAFIGTWMPERGPFLAEIIARGVPLSIWGDRWYKAPEWPLIRTAWRGPAVFDHRYAEIILSAKVVLGLLSKCNRDLHTLRSMEVPSLGGALCAERTSEHLALYHEDREAVFWKSPEECAVACQRLLANEEYRRNVARCGQLRCLQNGHFNEKVTARILRSAMEETHNSEMSVETAC